jgi:hypothetical protein
MAASAYFSEGYVGMLNECKMISMKAGNKNAQKIVRGAHFSVH